MSFTGLKANYRVTRMYYFLSKNMLKCVQFTFSSEIAPWTTRKLKFAPVVKSVSSEKQKKNVSGQLVYRVKWTTKILMACHTTPHREFSSYLASPSPFFLFMPPFLSFSLTTSFKRAMMSLVELSKFCRLEESFLFNIDAI